MSARSFLEAKKANKNGRYVVGNEKEDEFLDQPATLQHVLRLEVAYEEDATKSKTLYLDDIYDLQSRLMLLGRENKNTEESIADGIFEKEYFVKVVGFQINCIFSILITTRTKIRLLFKAPNRKIYHGLCHVYLRISEVIPYHKKNLSKRCRYVVKPKGILRN